MEREPLQRLLTAAKLHGDESDPDHEVGDLQDVLRSCWERLTPGQRRAVYDEHKGLVSEWLGSPPARRRAQVSPGVPVVVVPFKR